MVSRTVVGLKIKNNEDIMSNDARGYIEFIDSTDLTGLMNAIEKKHDVGIGVTTVDKLYNFPESTLPNSDKQNFIFEIGDESIYCQAQYLIDYLDYAPETDIGFPVGGKDRLNILLDALSDMFKIENVNCSD